MPLVLDSGTVIPPANLTDLPYCMDLVIKDLPPHLKPQRIKIAKADSGPFLFTPITQFNSIDRRDKQKNKNKIGKHRHSKAINKVLNFIFSYSSH